MATKIFSFAQRREYIHMACMPSSCQRHYARSHGGESMPLANVCVWGEHNIPVRFDSCAVTMNHAAGSQTALVSRKEEMRKHILHLLPTQTI